MAFVANFTSTRATLHLASFSAAAISATVPVAIPTTISVTIPVAISPITSAPTIASMAVAVAKRTGIEYYARCAISAKASDLSRRPRSSRLSLSRRLSRASEPRPSPPPPAAALPSAASLWRLCPCPPDAAATSASTSSRFRLSSVCVRSACRWASAYSTRPRSERATGRELALLHFVP